MVFMYPEPESNRYGHSWPLDFKSSASTYSAIRALILVYLKSTYVFRSALECYLRESGAPPSTIRENKCTFSPSHLQPIRLAGDHQVPQ